MKVLVTGLSGFTGVYLRRSLEQAGYAAIGLHSDLKDWEAVADEITTVSPDAVIHLAAISYVPSGSNVDAYAVNTLGTQGLLEALASLPRIPQKVILASSSNVYGLFEGPLTETSATMPINHYGCSKLAMEHMSATYRDRLPIIVARPFNYTGIGQSKNFLIPKIVRHFQCRKETIELGNIDVERDFSDVRWVAYAYKKLLDLGCEGETYNICSGRAVSIGTIIKTLERMTGHSPKVVVNPEYVRKTDIKTQKGDPSKLLGMMGSYDIPPLEQTLEWMLTAPIDTDSTNFMKV